MFMSFNARATGLELSAEETVGLAYEAGFGGVDLLVRDLVEAGADLNGLRARMDDLGLCAGAFPLPVQWRESAEEFERDLARLPAYAEAASVLGLQRTGTWILPETLEMEPAGRGDVIAETTAWHGERLGRIARVLDAEGIRLGLEVIGVASSRTGRGRPFVHRLADLDRVLGPFLTRNANVGILVDAWHLYAAGEPIETALAWGVERVIWVHVADLPASASGDRAAMRDQDRGLPGEHGAVESRRLLERLSVAGYDGPVTAEPLENCRSLAALSPSQVVDRLAAAMQSVWPVERH